MAQPQYFRLIDFSGGHNPNQHPALLNDNEAVDILNWSLSKPGSLISRHGWGAFNTGADLPANVVQLGALRVPSDLGASKVLAHLVNGQLVTVSEAGASSALASGFGTAKGKFVAAQDLVLYANGVRAPIAYNGVSARALGISTPTAAPNPGLNGSGSLAAGTYSYSYTFYSSTLGVESGGSPLASITVAANSRVQVSLGTSADPDVTHVRVYRRGPGSAVFVFLAQVAKSAGSYLDDGTVPINPSMGFTTPGEVRTPPNLERIAYYNGYYFGSVGRMLYWSSALTPHEWPALNSNELPFVGNDEVVAMAAHQDALLVFGRQNLLLVTGVAGNWSFTRVDTELGAAGVDAVMELGGQVIFLSAEGLRAFPGLGPVAPNLSRQLVHMPPEVREKAVLAYIPNGEELWTTINGLTYAVYLPTQAVTKYDLNPVAVLTGGADGESSPILAFGDRRVLGRFGGVTTDNGAPIKLMWRSKVFQFPNPETTKFLRRVGAFGTPGVGVTLQVVVPDTGQTFSAYLGVSSTFVTSEWDEFQWDVGIWSAEGLVYSVDSLPAQSLSGNTMQLVITAVTNQRAEIAPPVTLLYREANRFLGV